MHVDIGMAVFAVVGYGADVRAGLLRSAVNQEALLALPPTILARLGSNWPVGSGMGSH
jgi:hypothetical protein